MFSDPEIAGELTDERLVEHMLQVEIELARAEAALDLIPKKAAEAIAARTPDLQLNWDQLAEATAVDGFPVGNLVAQLRVAVGQEAANYVHWGATTQDILDTARVLQFRGCLLVLENDLNSLIRVLADLARRHRNTLMAGRTHSQQALPITFGFKVTGWISPLLRHRQRLRQMRSRLLVLQFGGGVGTLSVLGEKGLEVQAVLANALGLAIPLMPWHTQRDVFAELAGWLSMLTGSLGKVAQDLILMAQSEVGEVSEGSSGGSSTMPQKQNPISSELILGAAQQNAILLSGLHLANLQEHERGTHGWQLELLNLPLMLSLTGSALKKAVSLCETLHVDAERMANNVKVSNGLMLSEAVTFILSQHMDRQAAAKLVGQASRQAQAEGKHLIEIVKEKVQIDIDWRTSEEEAGQLGSAQAFIDRVLGEVETSLAN
ncbi:MAG: 3-carboxy-cis,cis-muconate cycloisomerase [Anaerolineales bacterium]